MQTLRNSDSDSAQPAVAPIPRADNWLKTRVVDAFLDPHVTTQQVTYILLVTGYMLYNSNGVK